MISLELDTKSWELLNKLYNSSSLWEQHMHHEFPKELAEAAKEHMIPMLAVRPVHNQDLERSIRYDTVHMGNVWEVNFYGFLYGLYVDQGNFPSGDVIYAASKGLRYFPVDARLPELPTYRAELIHGMGAQTTGAPTHYSEKTVDWLANGKALEVAYKYMDAFLAEVIK